MLKIKAKNLPIVKIASIDEVKLGEWVLAIGSPFGFNQTVTAGIVSGKQRKLAGDNYVPYIQTDVAINPGNSGGPLFNLSGEVIGVNAQIYSRTGGFMGVSFAIPSDTVNDVFYQLKTKGKVSRGWLGVYIQEIDDKLAKSFGLKKARGALVSKILPDSPAEKAKFKQGDVILKFNDNDINKSTDLPLIVGQSKVGKSFRVQIIINKLITNLSVTLEELPTEEKIATIGTKKITSNSNRPLIIFPQGTRVLPNDRPPFKKGATRIYEEIKIICQPVAINSGYVWPKKGSKQSHKTIIVSILEPIGTGLGKDEFTRILENKIYSELNLLN